MKIALTGASGYVGSFIDCAARSVGHEVITLNRERGFDLTDPAATPLAGVDALVHAAFAHVPGRYRGGEGDDPDTFRKLNLDGSTALFAHAKSSGVARVVFLSSRAVYDGLRGPLTEDVALSPTSLYGQVKAGAENALFSLSDKGFCGVALRATGVYGRAAPGLPHKWQALFTDYLAGKPIARRKGSEVHGADIADAVLRLLSAPADRVSGLSFNASDILLDRHDLLTRVARLTGSHHPPPPPDKSPVAEMDCARLRGLGWVPGGLARLEDSLRGLI